MKQFLQATPFINSDHPEVIAFTKENIRGMHSAKEKAVALFYAVRDGFRYDPYQIDLSIDGLKADTCLKNGYGWCVSKSILLAAACRSAGIPAKLGFADVRNHMSSEKMLAFLHTDMAFWHGYTFLFIEGKWLKATPAFNRELCVKAGTLPAEFDGLSDAVFPSSDIEGHPYIEYIHDRGSFADVPLNQIIETYKKEYAPVFELWESKNKLNL